MSDRLESVLAQAVPQVATAAVALIAAEGSVVASAAVGELVRYTDADFTVAARRPRAARDSIFDVASISKLFTTCVIMSLVEEGRFDLDAPVAAWLPAHYAGRPLITPRHLLTHTAGLQPTRRIDLELPDASPAERMEAILATPITTETGGPYLYSDVGMVTAGRIAELAGGAPLDVLVRERVTARLGLDDTGYGPVAQVERVAATEWKPERHAMARGEVHDETSYGLGGIAGHAGVFSTADDLLRFGEALRQDELPLTGEMTRDQGVQGAAFRHGLGVRIGDPSIIGPLTGAFGHSGFTGTSLVVDPARGLTVVLLTNAVHPVRGRDGIRDLRHAVATEALKLSKT